MDPDTLVSVVIPTCDRKESLLHSLSSLNQSEFPTHEVIIVDSGDEYLHEFEWKIFSALSIMYIRTPERSVCIQRNIGIRRATSPWIFLCDDDVEVPADYLRKLINHTKLHADAGAVSGLFLQKENDKWQGQYPVTSTIKLLWRFIFQSTIWGEINCSQNILSDALKNYYNTKGNHISKAGWPVITNFSGDFSKTPVYTLGSALVKKEWLQKSLFDEVLDSHGIGDNYGVAIGFPQKIHLLNHTFVYHHHEAANRIKRLAQYYRRGLALDYFRETRSELQYVRKGWLLWSLLGNFIYFIADLQMVKVNFKLLTKILFGKNPYTIGRKANIKVVSPQIN